MATIHLTDPEKTVERDNVFVKATGWVVGYDLDDSDKVGVGGGLRKEKVDHVNYPPHRIEKIVGKATHHAPPGGDGVNTI